MKPRLSVQYLPLSPEVQEAQEALVHPTQENHTGLQNNIHSVSPWRKAWQMFLAEYLPPIYIYMVSFQEVWWNYTVQSTLDSGIGWPFLQIFQGFFPFPATSWLTGISTRRQEREVKGEETPMFYYFLVHDLLGRRKLFTEMRIMHVSN